MTYHGTYLVRISSLLTPRLPGLLFALYIYNAFVRVRVSSPLQRSFASSWASSGCRPCKSTTAARAGVCVVFAVNVLCVCCVCVCVCVFFLDSKRVIYFYPSTPSTHSVRADSWHPMVFPVYRSGRKFKGRWWVIACLVRAYLEFP